MSYDFGVLFVYNETVRYPLLDKPGFRILPVYIFITTPDSLIV